MAKEDLNQELSTDEMKNISGDVFDFGGSDKSKPNKRRWNVDGADFRGII